MGSLVEWAAAAVVAMAVLWLGFTWIGPWLAQGPAPAAVEANEVPEGVPNGAQSVALLVLVDGTRIRVGETQSDIHARLGDLKDDPAPRVSKGPFGDRLTRSFERQGTEFFLVCERTEPGGPVKVARIYLPR
jgi:hypothetical protein